LRLLVIGGFVAAAEMQALAGWAAKKVSCPKQKEAGLRIFVIC
jgi:hypothetical protein